MSVKNPVRLLNLMVIAVRAINAIKRAGGEEGFKFFLKLVGLQQIAAPAVMPVEVLTVVKLAETATESAMPERVKPGTILSAPVPAKPLPADKPERILTGEAPLPAPKPKRVAPVFISGDFAAKLNGAAKSLGLEDKTPLAQFRKVLGEVGRGTEYWGRCREALFVVLKEGLLKDEADWKVLTNKMKVNLFFTDKRNSEAFLSTCPKDILASLVTNQDGFPEMVANIRAEQSPNPSSINRISFIMEACGVVGEEGKVLLANCKRAVNRMRQMKFIGPQHWLVGRVAAMRESGIPEQKYYNPNAQPQTSSEPQEQKPEVAQAPAEETVALEQKTAEVRPEPVVGTQNPEEVSLDQLEQLTAPTNSDKPAAAENEVALAS